MKKILLILILCGYVYSQHTGDPFDFFIKRADRDLSILTYPVRWTDTTMPMTKWQDGWMKLAGDGNVLMTYYDPFLYIPYNITSSFEISATIAFDSDPKLAVGLFAVNSETNWNIRYNSYASNQISMYQGGSAAYWHLPHTYGDTAFHTYLWKFRNNTTDTVYTFKDGVLINTYTGTNLFNSAPLPTTEVLAIGNVKEVTTDGSYSSTYSYNHVSTAGEFKIKRFTFDRNDTMLSYDFNQSSTQILFPRKFISSNTSLWSDSVQVVPYEEYEYGGSTSFWSYQPNLLRNGAGMDYDTLDADLIVTGVKSGYKNPYISLSNGFGNYDFTNRIRIGAYGCEPFVFRDSLFVIFDGSMANGISTVFPGDNDTARGVVRLGSEWQPLGYGFKTVSGVSSGGIYAFPYNNKIIALGYLTTIQGVGATGYCAQWDGTVWSTMGSGLSAESFSGVSAYGYAYIGYNGTGSNRRYITKWNGSTYDTLRGGLTNNPFTLFADSSTGERLIIIGSANGYFQGGVQTNNQGIFAWSEDSLKYKKWNNLSCGSGGVMQIRYSNGWYYLLGDFSSITDGVTTVTSKGIARYKSGTGLQAIGTGIYFGESVLASITGADVHDNKLYMTGSFSRVSGFLSKGIAGIDLATGKLIDMGYECNLRGEGCVKWTDVNGQIGTAGKTYIIFVGDFNEVNGVRHNYVVAYDPTLNN